MSNANLGATPYHTVVDTNGIPVSGAKIYTYTADSNDPKVTYTDYDSGVEQTNPIVADSAGRFELWLGGGLYKLVYKDSDDVTIRTIDNVGTGSGGDTAVMTVQTITGSEDSLKSLSEGVVGSVVALGYRTAGDGGGGLFRWSDGSSGGDDGAVVDGNTTYTSGRWVRVIEDTVNPRWWGAYGDGSDDKDFIDAAVWYARENGKSMFLPEGTYRLSSDTTFTDVTVIFDPKAIIAVNNFRPDIDVVINDSNQHFSCSIGTAPILHVPGVRPEWFGATTNEEAAAETYFDFAMQAAAGDVLLSDGTYTVDDVITPVSNVTLRGMGNATTIEPSLGFSGDWIMDGSVNNFSVRDFELKSQYAANTDGLRLSGNDIVIERIKFDSHPYSAINIGGNAGSDTKNIAIRNNRFVDCASAETDPVILLESGSNIDIHDNVIEMTDELTIPDYAIKLDRNSYTLSDVTIRDNRIKGYASGVKMESDNSPDGNVIIRDNDVEVCNDSATGIGINLKVNTTDNVQSYVVSNNNLYSSEDDAIGIKFDSLTSPIYCDGNSINLPGTASVGISEESLTSDTSYGTNFIDASDKYLTSSSRYCYLGTDVRTEIDGSNTTVYGDMTVTGDMAVDGDISFGNLSADTLTSIGDVTSSTGNFVAVEGGLSLGLLGDALKIAHNSIVQASGTGPFTADTTGCVGSIGIPNVASNEGTGSHRYLTMRNPILKTDSWVQVTSYIQDDDYVASTSTWTVQPSSLVDGTMTFYVFQYNGSNAATDMTATYMIIN